MNAYLLKTCDSCRKSTRWLTERNIPFKEIPIRETPPSEKELLRALADFNGDIRKLFNTSGEDYRKLGIADKLATLSNAEAISLLASNGNLIKRPFLVSEDTVLVGFKAEEWAAALGPEQPRSHRLYPLLDAPIIPPMFMDTRAQAKRLLGSFEQRERKAVIKTAGCFLLALGVVFLPGLLGSDVFKNLPSGAKASLGIMVFAAALWVTEAMPAFAVALLVIGLQIAILGNPGGVWAAEGDTKAWIAFVQPWSSPTMWLFLGGFVLAHACSKTRLDEWLAGMVLGRFATSPAKLVASVMAITFLFSMFMSNTATAAMMIAVTAPVLIGLPKQSRLGKGLVLAVAAGANLGGIGTIIGTPPNAIAAGELQGKVDFIKWMAIALPPALLLATATYFLIWRIYLRGIGENPAISLTPAVKGDARQYRHRITVMVVFAVTVAMWMGESLTGIPSPVVSFIPIVALAVSGVIGARDMRLLPWDVLLLLAGGLSLGVGIEVTGLAAWFAGSVPENLGIISIAVVFSLLGLFLSNLMSNTAAAALLIPLASSLAGNSDATLVTVSIAISCSVAMALPISTPPNAIAHSTERLSSRDFLIPGLVVAAGMAAVIPWLVFVLG